MSAPVPNTPLFYSVYFALINAIKSCLFVYSYSSSKSSARTFKLSTVHAFNCVSVGVTARIFVVNDSAVSASSPSAE